MLTYLSSTVTNPRNVDSYVHVCFDPKFEKFSQEEVR
jgi:hypothetical protein